MTFVSFASATVTENNYIRYGIIENDGSMTMTSNPIDNSNFLSFVCSSPSCSSVAGALFTNPTNIPSSSIPITYPSILINPNGYGLYFYKSGYIPFEAWQDYADPVLAPDYIDYLARKRTCEIPMSNLQVSYNYSNGVLTTNVDVGSPLNHSGSLNYVPVAILSEYSTDVKVNLTVTGSSGYSEVQNANINFSDKKAFVFNNAIGSGIYNVAINAYTNDGKCLNNGTASTRSINITGFVVNDTIAPSINVISPANTTYITNPVLVSFSATDNVAVSSLWFYNGTRNVSYSAPINLTLVNGSYNFIFYANDSSGNLNSTSTSFSVNISSGGNITNDTTAPGSVTGLYVINTTNTSASFGWTNPLDADFNGTIVYLNGVYNRTLGNGINQTTFSGLNPNTNYTITINTLDTSGNVNGINVSLSVFTNANTGDITPPGVTIISPTNTTYSSSNIVFNVSLNEFGLVAFTLDNGVTNHSMSSIDNLHFNYSASGLANGGYTFRVYAADFANNLNYTESKVFTVNSSIADTTAPGSVTNLRNVSSTNTTISWNWTNPGDFDFNGTRVYVDNVFVIKLAPGIQSYIGSGFLANTSHTITINTLDIAGNVNGTNLTNSAYTTANSGGSGGDDDNNGHDSKARNYTIMSYGQDGSINKIIYGTSDDSGTIFLNSKETAKEFNWWPWIIFFLILEIIIVLLLIFVASRKKKRK